MARFTPLERVVRTVLQGAGRLPEGVQGKLGGGPVVIDGQQLHPEVAMAVRAMRAAPGPSFEDLPLPRARAAIDAEARLFGSHPEVEAVLETTIPTVDDVIVPARVYDNHPERTDSAALVYFHGGGWVVGGLESVDSVCRELAVRTGAVIVAVDYRLAPENRYPAAVEDADAAYRWVLDNVDRLGVNPEKVGVAGDSAGGNLAAVTALRLREARRAGDEVRAPALQVLFFPVTDLSTKRRSYELFSDGFFLTEKQMDWYADHYVPDVAQRRDPQVSPLLADDLSDLPPAYVGVAGFDVLRDEGIAYAERLREAGGEVELFIERRHIHAYVNATGVGRTGSAALDHAAQYIRSRFEGSAREH